MYKVFVFCGLEDFKGLAIERLWTEQQTYQVIHLDFSSFANSNAEQIAEELSKRLVSSIPSTQKISVYDDYGKLNSPGVILDKYAKTVSEKSVVLLIDEYDAPLTHHLGNEDELNK